MKIKDFARFIQELAKDYPNHHVFLSRDSEGNAFGKASNQVGVCSMKHPMHPTGAKYPKAIVLYPGYEGFQVDIKKGG